MWATTVLSCVFVSAYVAFRATMALRHEAAITDRDWVGYSFLCGGLVVGGGGVVLHHCRAGAAEQWRSRRLFGIQYLILNGGVAYAIGERDQFARSVAAAPFLLWSVWLLGKEVVHYDSTSPHFYVSRSSFYGLVRALSVRFVPLPELVPLLLGLCESVVMYAVRSTAYSFGTRSSRFAEYTVWKSLVLASVPALENALLGQRM